MKQNVQTKYFFVKYRPHIEQIRIATTLGQSSGKKPYLVNLEDDIFMFTFIH